MKTLIKNLTDHGFKVQLFDNPDLLIDHVCNLVGTGHSIGMGGCETVRELGLLNSLQEQGNTIYALGYQHEMERGEIIKKAHTADFFFSSANAISEDGTIINIDGTSNRVSSICYGPGTVVFIIGRNKITQTVADGIYRAKNIAAPKNAVNLGRKTPCATTGKCMDCNSSDRMCRSTLLLERPPRNKDVYVFLINKDYGF